MNKKKEIDKLARLTVLANFVNSKLKEQKTLVKSFVTEEDKVLKGVEHKLNVIIRSISVSIVKRLEKINLKFITIIKRRLYSQWN